MGLPNAGNPPYMGTTAGFPRRSHKRKEHSSMFITPAFAQAAGAAPAAGMGAGDLLVQFAPILLLVVIFWFLIFRPQQKRMKAHQAMLGSIARGDTIVTTGGIIGKVTKAVDGEDLEVEIAQGTRVKIARSGVTDVRSKSTPVNDNKAA
jgi:preprotein translocase subunit YajC